MLSGDTEHAQEIIDECMADAYGTILALGFMHTEKCTAFAYAAARLEGIDLDHEEAEKAALAALQIVYEIDSIPDDTTERPRPITPPGTP
jgi:hypothetical protein